MTRGCDLVGRSDDFCDIRVQYPEMRFSKLTNFLRSAAAAVHLECSTCIGKQGTVRPSLSAALLHR